MARPKKYRKAKRVSKFLKLDRQSRKLYGLGYLKYLEGEGIVTRTSFYQRVRCRTLPDSVAQDISDRLQVAVSDWYEGSIVPDTMIQEHLNLSQLDELI